MNTRIYKTLFIIGLLMLGFNNITIAQNKEKPSLIKAQSNNTENEEKAIKLLEERMETASPEEKIKIQKKLEAYYANKKKDAYSLANAKEQIQEAYFQYEESERKLENAKAAIEKSEVELIQMEKEGNASKEEILARKQKLEKAKQELDKSQEALKKQMAAIKAKRAEMIKSE